MVRDNMVEPPSSLQPESGIVRYSFSSGSNFQCPRNLRASLRQCIQSGLVRRHCTDELHHAVRFAGQVSSQGGRLTSSYAPMLALRSARVIMISSVKGMSEAAVVVEKVGDFAREALVVDV